MLDLYLLEWMKWQKLKISKNSLWGVVLYGFFTVAIMHYSRGYFEYALKFSDAIYQANIIFCTVVGPFLYGGMAIYYFYRPIKQKTERTMALLPIRKLPFFLIQLLFLLSVYLLMGLIMVLSVAAFAWGFGFQSVSAGAILQGFYQTNLQVILMFFLQMPLVFCVLFYRNQLSGVFLIIGSVVGTVLLVDSPFTYLYPYTAVYGYVEGTAVPTAYLGIQLAPLWVILYGLIFLFAGGYVVKEREI